MSKKGSAEVAGIKPGDVLLTYNGENVLGAEQFVRLVRETPAGRRVRVSIWRNGKEQSVAVTTASPHPLLQSRSVDDFSALNFLDVHEAPMLYVPKIIILWDTPSIGIECEPVDTQLAQFFGVSQGVLVRSVGKGSAAEKAGFKAGDVMISAGNHAVKTSEDFRHVLRSGQRTIPVCVTRDHKQLTLTLSAASDREN